MGRTGSSCIAQLAVLSLLLLAGDSAAARKDDASADGTTTMLQAVLPDVELPGEKDRDSYLCTSLALPTETLHLTGFTAHAATDAISSMMLYGCKSPAEEAPVWSCYMHSPCGAGREAVLMGWSATSPSVKLPPGVSFSVGAGTGIATVVLQVHYTTGRPAGDRSGFALKLSPQPTPYAAGMLTFASRFGIPAGKPSHRVASTCCYAGFEPLHAMAFRVHTHELGRSVWMEQKTGAGQKRIAEGDPQKAQGFTPVSQKDLRLLPGDRLTATCDFDSSSRQEETEAGADANQEMCNMFLMVWSENPYFMVCGNDKTYVRPEGPGGIPEGAALSREGTGLWKPPGPLGHHENDGSLVGQIAGISKGPDDTVWLLHRGAKPWDAATFFSGGRAEHITDTTPVRGPAVLQLKQETGEVLRAWGDNKLVMPHGIAVSQQDDAIWVVDAGRHQVLKYDVHGKELKTLGVRGRPGHDTAHFCKPTSVALSNTGDVFVADGYCNSRVMHFTADGDFVQQITLPKGKLQVPHSIAVDDCANALYVADRDASAVRRFQIAGDFAGSLTRSWELGAFGPVYAVTAAPYGALLAVTWDKASQSGHVLHLDTSDNDDSEAGSGVLDSWELTGVRAPHDITLSAAPVTATLGGSRSLAVYVAETAHGRPSHLHKFIIHHPGVQVREAKHVMLSDMDLPELEEAAAAIHGGAEKTSVAAAEIERAAAQIERAAAQLARAMAKQDLSDTEKLAALHVSQAAASLGGEGGLSAGGDAAVSQARGGTAAKALSKAAAAVGGVGQTLGFGKRGTLRRKGPGHYLVAVMAPVGAIALFVGLAIALTSRMGGNGSHGGFQPLPSRDSFLVSSGSSGEYKGRIQDPAEVVVSSTNELSKSIRRPSAIAADMRRAANLAAQAVRDGGASPLSGSPLGSLRSNSGDFSRRSGSEVPAQPSRRPSIRRASAAPSIGRSSHDSMRRTAVSQGPEIAADKRNSFARTSAGSIAEELQEAGCGAHEPAVQQAEGLYTISSSLLPSSQQNQGHGSPPQPQPQPLQRVTEGHKKGTARSSWSGSLTSINEFIGPDRFRELAAGVEGSRSKDDAGKSSTRRPSPLQKTDSQQL